MNSSSFGSKAKAESDKGNRSEQIYFDINAKDEYCFASEADVMLLRTGLLFVFTHGVCNAHHRV